MNRPEQAHAAELGLNHTSVSGYLWRNKSILTAGSPLFCWQYLKELIHVTWSDFLYFVASLLIVCECSGYNNHCWPDLECLLLSGHSLSKTVVSPMAVYPEQFKIIIRSCLLCSFGIWRLFALIFYAYVVIIVCVVSFTGESIPG